MFKKKELALAVSVVLSVSQMGFAENSAEENMLDEAKVSRPSAAGSIPGLSVPTAIAVGIVGAAILGG